MEITFTRPQFRKCCFKKKTHTHLVSLKRKQSIFAVTVWFRMMFNSMLSSGLKTFQPDTFILHICACLGCKKWSMSASPASCFSQGLGDVISRFQSSTFPTVKTAGRRAAAISTEQRLQRALPHTRGGGEICRLKNLATAIIGGHQKAEQKRESGKFLRNV